jgi:hypothetical protein
MVRCLSPNHIILIGLVWSVSNCKVHSTLIASVMLTSKQMKPALPTHRFVFAKATWSVLKSKALNRYCPTHARQTFYILNHSTFKGTGSNI